MPDARAGGARDGFTFRPAVGGAPPDGFAVCAHPGAGWRIAADRFSADHISRFLATHRERLARRPELCLGGWLDPGRGVVHLDLSVVLTSCGEALRLAARHEQAAIYDLARRRTIALPSRPR